jgi:hypothetical protein
MMIGEVISIWPLLVQIGQTIDKIKETYFG